jgi:hypothetical protein
LESDQDNKARVDDQGGSIPFSRAKPKLITQFRRQYLGYGSFSQRTHIQRPGPNGSKKGRYRLAFNAKGTVGSSTVKNRETKGKREIVKSGKEKRDKRFIQKQSSNEIIPSRDSQILKSKIQSKNFLSK